jgi:tetratricopeptide (TPR) repeat protein
LLLPLLAGCGSKTMNALKVNDTLMEAVRHAQVDTDDKEARRYVDSAVALAPNDPATYFGDLSATPPQIGVAGVFEAVGDDPALMDYMTQAVRKFPDDYRGYQILADAQGRQGRAAEQKATAAKLAALLTKKLQTPGATNIEALTLLQAQAYFDSGDPVTGAATYQKAIQAYPASAEPSNALAYAYAVTNDRAHLPEALTLAQKALALAQKGSGSTQEANEGEVAAIQDTLAWVQYRLGDDKDAEQNLLDAVKFDPRLPEMRFHLGSVYAAEGKTDAARAELGHAVLLCPGYAEAQAALDRLPKTGR